MSPMVQPDAPRESHFAYYLLMGILGTSFLAIVVWLVLTLFE
ncbi:MAG: hypothetical protein RRA94_02340 [Bacteroidota bacterium]|nr:hypothetical protein [Bacteroidota bacterium]